MFMTLSQIATPFRGILLDAYGVFWRGNKVGLFPGSSEMMEKLVQAGKVVGILSNTTQLAQTEIEKLAKHGLVLGRHFHFMLTSGELAKQVFSKEMLPFPTPLKKYWLFGKNHAEYAPPYRLFEESVLTEAEKPEAADFVYVCVPHLEGRDQTDLELFREEVKKLPALQLPMVCANPDRFAQEGSPPQLVVRQGGIAALYEEMGGKVFYIGKPSHLAFQKAMERFALHGIYQPSDVLMVGDTPETDIRGALQYGMQSALITKTGIFSERPRELSSQETPHFYIDRFSHV